MQGIVLKRPLSVVDIEYMDGPYDINGNRLASRKERLMQLTQQVRAGTYRIPAEWVAESILRWRGRAGRRN